MTFPLLFYILHCLLLFFFLPRPHSWVSMQQKANMTTLTLHLPAPPLVFRSSSADCEKIEIPLQMEMGKLSWGEKDKEQRPWLTWERQGPLKAEVLVLYRLEDQSSQHFPSGPSKRRATQERLLFWCSSASVSIPELRMLNLLSEPAPKKQAFLL